VRATVSGGRSCAGFRIGSQQLSVIARISCLRFYFRLFPGAIRTPQAPKFVTTLQVTIGRRW
jgi:hypothetical protein